MPKTPMTLSWPRFFATLAAAFLEHELVDKVLVFKLLGIISIIVWAPLVLALGTIEPRKNLPVLVQGVLEGSGLTP